MSKLIYLAGAITGLSVEDATEWRQKIKNTIEDMTSLRWKCVDPVSHIPYCVNQEVERECFRWDVWKLKQSALVVCDFDHPSSIGTTWELAVAKENGIPIIGLNTTGASVHPWWQMAAIHICNSIEDLIDYLCLHYLGED